MPRSKRETEEIVVSSPVKPKRAPARTLESRENQLIALAYDLAEKQLRDGTASSQTIHEFAQRGSTRDQLEKERLVHENELLKAKTDAIKSARSQEELYEKAISAMRMYNGDMSEGDYEH